MSCLYKDHHSEQKYILGHVYIENVLLILYLDTYRYFTLYPIKLPFTEQRNKHFIQLKKLITKLLVLQKKIMPPTTDIKVYRIRLSLNCMYLGIYATLVRMANYLNALNLLIEQWYILLPSHYFLIIV